MEFIFITLLRNSIQVNVINENSVDNQFINEFVILVDIYVIPINDKQKEEEKK